MKEKSKKWGSSPEDSDELLAAVANFSALPIDKKLMCVTALSSLSIRCDDTLKAERKQRKDAQHYNQFHWTSNLYKEELEMIGDLDPNEAEEIYQGKRFMGLSFEARLRDEESYRVLSGWDLSLVDEVKPASSYMNEFFVDHKFCKSDKAAAKSQILLDKERKKILKECRRYLMKTEWLMDNWMKKKTEFILFDEGDCSETKFNQSDVKQRKEMMLERHQKKMTRKLMARKKMTGEGNDVLLVPINSQMDQSDKEKYEKARSLKKYTEGIRKAYTKDFGNKDLTKRQVAVATYLIDKSALRAGNEKDDDDEADTVGCCTLEVENVKPEPLNILKAEGQSWIAIGHFKNQLS